jgi:hypothetical protein
VNIVVRSLRCDSVEAKRTDRARVELAWFYRVCANIGGTPFKDERAVVYVNSPNFYFNITRSLHVEDVKFDGINGFSRLLINETVNDVTTTKSLQTPFWPAKLCRLSTPVVNFKLEGQNTELI